MNSPALRKTWEGQVVDGKFALRQWLGGSDHSAVFLTEFEGPSHQTAIKLVPANTLNVDQLARWRPALRLSHPHLLRLFDMGRCELDGIQLLYLVMELAEEDLSQILPQRALTPAETSEFLPPVLDALSYLHAKGFVQGGIKPSNILASDNQLKLSVDRLQPVGQSGSRTRAFSVYDAPELATGTVTPAADIWSLGITLVEALTQKPPAVEAMQDPAVPHSISEPFRGIIRACLRRDPQQRNSIPQIERRMQPGLPEASPAPSVSAEPKGPNWRIIIALATAIIVAGLLYPVLTHHGQSAKPDIQPEPVQTSSQSTPAPATPSQPVPAPPAPIESKPAVATPPASSPGSVTQQVLPDIPRSARNTIEGKIRVTVKVEVDSAGKVTSATLTSAGPSQYFANLALKASQHWEFTPPRVGGQPVASSWLLHYRIGRAATEVTPAPADQ